MTPAQHKILRRITEGYDLREWRSFSQPRPRRIAALWLGDDARPVAVGTLDRMVARGWLERCSATFGFQYTTFTLTDEGRAALGESGAKR